MPSWSGEWRCPRHWPESPLGDELTCFVRRLQEETAKVEEHLINGKFTEAILACFNTHKLNAFDSNLLEPLLKLLRLSPSLSASLAKPEMYSGIEQKLGHKKAVVRLNLLRLVRNILEAREVDYFTPPRDQQLRSLLDYIRSLAEKDSAVLVRNLASELARSQVDEGQGEPSLSSTSAGFSATKAGSNRARSGPRRVYTPPSLHTAASVPVTPTHAHRPSLPGTVYTEVAASPRRSAVMAHERDSTLYRPRSRDGSGIPISSLPRRVSGDMGTGSGSALAGRSRLPRNSGVFSRPSASESTTTSAAASSGSRSRSSRSYSGLSNKENNHGSGENEVSMGGNARDPLLVQTPTTASANDRAAVRELREVRETTATKARRARTTSTTSTTGASDRAGDKPRSKWVMG
jgi:hypothetical protein